MSEQALGVDRIQILTEAAIGLVSAMDADIYGHELAAKIDALPASILTGFVEEIYDETWDTSGRSESWQKMILARRNEESQASYLGGQTRIVFELVEQQAPHRLNLGFAVERVIKSHEAEHGPQSWSWVKTVVESALPSEDERLYQDTLRRLVSDHVVRDGRPPEPTPWVLALSYSPESGSRGIRETLRYQRVHRQGVEFYESVTGRKVS